MASSSAFTASQPLSRITIQGDTFGTGPDTIIVTLAEDAWQGDALANIFVDGALLTAQPVAITAEHPAGAGEVVILRGAWGPGSHAAVVSFLNDAWGGTPDMDRNLYVEGVTFNGQATPGLADPVELNSTGSAAFAASGPALVQGSSFGAGPDIIIVTLAEDAWRGNALANISVDGVLLTAQPVAVTALQGADAIQDFAFRGDFGSGPHTVAVSFLNDAWGGTPNTDRNLYVDDITFNGQAAPSLVDPVKLSCTGAEQFVTPIYTEPSSISFAANQYITAGNVLQFDSAQPWSITSTIKVSELPPGPGYNLPDGGADLIFGDTNGAPYTGYEAWIDMRGDLRVRVMNSYLDNNFIDVAASTNLADGRVHFIGASYDGSSSASGVKLFIDGVQQATQILRDTLSGSRANDGPIIIGNQLNGWQDQFQLRGEMWDFSLSNMARDASWFRLGTPGTPAIDAHTQLAYEFDRGGGLGVNDLSGHGYDGGLSSTAMWTYPG